MMQMSHIFAIEWIGSELNLMEILGAALSVATFVAFVTDKSGSRGICLTVCFYLIAVIGCGISLAQAGSDIAIFGAGYMGFFWLFFVAFGMFAAGFSRWVISKCRKQHFF